MALSFNDTMANAILNAFRNHIDGQAGETGMRIYAGTMPANVTVGMSGETVLAEFTIKNPCASDASGFALTIFPPADVTALATGTASWFRIFKKGASTSLIQGKVTDAAGNGELKLNRVAITQGEPVSIVEIKFTLS